MKVTKSSSGSGPRWAASASIAHLDRPDRAAAEARHDPAARADADPNWLGRQLLEALQQVKNDLAAQQLELSTSLLALERATTEDEAVAALENFLTAIATECAGSTPPLAVLTAAFGAENVATVFKVCEDAAVALDVEAKAMGGVITDRAAKHIANGMVQRLTQYAGRMGPRVPNTRRALLTRRERAPRAHRGHRRAVRLSADVSAGDGPPPEETPLSASVYGGARVPRAQEAAARSHTSERGGPRCCATSCRQAGGLQ